MADIRHRTDQRRLAITPDVETQARVLSGRLRQGELDEHRLSVAAYCGDEAARLVMPAHAPGECPLRWTDRECSGLWWEHDWPTPGATYHRRAMALATWGRPAIGVAAVTAASLILPAWTTAHVASESRGLVFRCPHQPGPLGTRCVLVDAVEKTIECAVRFIRTEDDRDDKAWWFASSSLNSVASLADSMWLDFSNIRLISADRQHKSGVEFLTRALGFSAKENPAPEMLRAVHRAVADHALREAK